MLRLTTSYISMCFLTTGAIYCNRFIWAGMKGSVLEFGVGRDPLIVAIKQYGFIIVQKVTRME